MEGPNEVEEKKNFLDNPTYKKIQKQAEQYQNVVTEILSQHREFTVGGDPNDRLIRIVFPSPKVEASVGKTYSKVYGNLLSDPDLLTEKQIIEKLTERKMWSEDKDKRIQLLRERLRRLYSSLIFDAEEKFTEEEFTDICNDYQKSEEELDKLNSERFSYTQNSLEIKANEAKIKDQMWQCVFEVQGENGNQTLTPVWKSFNEIDAETNRILFYRIMTECLAFWQGVPSVFLEDSPETTTGDNDTN